jgi:predicted anti-sigma-YlaC factor YlaD
MTGNDHERAREIVALAGAGDLSGKEQSWLRVHLQGCSACRTYADAAGQMIGALQSDFLSSDFALVRATQMRLRSRAVELRQRRERLWLICTACVFVGLSAAITTPFIWRAFEWIGVWAGVSNSVWQAGFTFFWVVPSLVAGGVLLARGTHLDNNLEMQWS